MSIWTTNTSSTVLDTPLESINRQQSPPTTQTNQQQQQLEKRKSSGTSVNQQQQHQHKTQSSPGSLANILGAAHFVSQSPSGSALAHSNNAIHIGVAVGAASTLASSIIHHSALTNHPNGNSNNTVISSSNQNNNSGNNNNNNTCGNCTYPQQRHSLSQSQILSYSPPNPNKVSSDFYLWFSLILFYL